MNLGEFAFRRSRGAFQHRWIGRGLRIPALLGAFLCTCGATAIGADNLKKLLDRPLKPAAIAFLANHTSDPAVPPRLRAALTAPSPAVREVAARVIGLGALEDLLPDLKAALATELDPEAAREEMRALCAVGGPRFDSALLEAAKRFRPRLDGELVRIIGRVRGIEALPLYFSTLRELALTKSDREAFFRLANSRENVLPVAQSLALGRGDAKSWTAILKVSSECDAKGSDSVLLQALGSQDAVIRGEASWFLAKNYQQNPPVDARKVLEAMPEEGAPSPERDDPELRFGSELLRRVLGKQPTEDDAWIACLGSNPECHLDSDFIESPLVDYLTPREREAITKRNETNLPPDAKAAHKPAATVPALPQSDQLALRLVTGLPRGLAEDLIRTGGCESTSARRWVSSAAIEFRADGLPRRVSLAGTPPTTECRQVAETIFLMPMAPSDSPAPSKSKYLYIALFDADCLACNEVNELPSDSATSPAEVYRVRAQVLPPKVKKKAEPIYPFESRKKLEEGVSIFEAVISRTGCVRDIRVLQSSYPLLDVSGMEAIAHWRYQPALLDGRPVSVCLTVTITYKLK